MGDDGDDGDGGDEGDDDRIFGADWRGTTDAARYLGIKPRMLYRLIDDGELPAYRVGRVIRLRVSDLEAFVENREIQPGDLAHL